MNDKQKKKTKPAESQSGKIVKEDLLEEAHKRLKLSEDDDSEGRALAIEDLEFLDEGGQWEEAILKKRGNRPCVTIDQITGHIDVVAGEQRMNKPSIRVHPIDSKADPYTAEVIAGLIRNMEFVSVAQKAYTTSSESTLQCGRGGLRILIKFVDNETFDQEIEIVEVKNVFSIHLDPMCKGDASKAKWGFVSDRITRDEYKQEYKGKKAPLSFKEAKGDLSDWADEDTVRIAEYFRKVLVGKKTKYLLKNGKIVNRIPKDGEYLSKRVVKDYKIEWFKISGNDILDGPKTWAGKYIPLIMVWGKELNIAEKRIVRGMVRKAKDAQRMYNYARSTMAETTAMQPKAPFMVAKEQIEGYESTWSNIDDELKPFIIYNYVEGLNEPKRVTPPIRSSGLEAEVRFSADEIRDMTMMQKASLGKEGQEKSGVAIEKRQEIGGIATYSYYDNLISAITYMYKVIIDLIPKVYNRARIIRILGLDEIEKQVSINSKTDLITNEKLDNVFDLNLGKYDITVTAGPGFTTQRQEAKKALLEFMEKDPESVPYIRHIYAKYLDFPGADEIVDIFKKIAPPGVVEQEEGEETEEEMAAQGQIQQGQMGEEETLQGDQTAEAIAEVQLQQEQEKLRGIELDNRKKELEGEKIIVEINKIVTSDTSLGRKKE